MTDAPVLSKPQQVVAGFCAAAVIFSMAAICGRQPSECPDCTACPDAPPQPVDECWRVVAAERDRGRTCGTTFRSSDRRPSFATDPQRALAVADALDEMLALHDQRPTPATMDQCCNIRSAVAPRISSLLDLGIVLPVEEQGEFVRLTEGLAECFDCDRGGTVSVGCLGVAAGVLRIYERIDPLLPSDRRSDI